MLKNALKAQDLKTILQLPQNSNLHYLKVEDFLKGCSMSYRRGRMSTKRGTSKKGTAMDKTRNK